MRTLRSTAHYHFVSDDEFDKLLHAWFGNIARVLEPGGRFVFSTWDSIKHNEFQDVVTEVAAEVFPNDPPRFLARVPFGYYDLDVVRDDLARSGFSDVSIETIESVSTAPSPRHVAIAFCQGTPLKGEIEERDAGLLEHVADRVTDAIAQRYGAGEVSAKIRAHIVTATAS